jgi:cyclic pyranopterin phosphate synthase
MTHRFQDTFGRIHDDLRISITDRCNLRCAYCMPVEPVWFPRSEILSYEETVRLVQVAARRGVRKVRLTGGEPLVRRDVPTLVRMLRAIEGVREVSLTTNGLRLDVMAEELAAAGLDRINVSLDSLDRERYHRLTRRDVLDRVLDGLAAAARAGLAPIKVNTVLVRGSNDDEVERLVGEAREHGWELRFIELMPLENGRTWDRSRVVPGAEVRRRIERRWPLVADGEDDPNAPARRYRFRDGRGGVGFVDSVTRPFCSTCNRLRLTADGMFRVCLYDDREVDLKTPLRAGATDGELDRLMVEAVVAKGRGGAIDLLERGTAATLRRTMHQIGG